MPPILCTLITSVLTYRVAQKHACICGTVNLLVLCCVTVIRDYWHRPTLRVVISPARGPPGRALLCATYLSCVDSTRHRVVLGLAVWPCD